MTSGSNAAPPPRRAPARLRQPPPERRRVRENHVQGRRLPVRKRHLRDEMRPADAEGVEYDRGEEVARNGRAPLPRVGENRLSLCASEDDESSPERVPGGSRARSNSRSRALAGVPAARVELPDGGVHGDSWFSSPPVRTSVRRRSSQTSVAPERAGGREPETSRERHATPSHSQVSFRKPVSEKPPNRTMRWRARSYARAPPPPGRGPERGKTSVPGAPRPIPTCRRETRGRASRRRGRRGRAARHTPSRARNEPRGRARTAGSTSTDPTPTCRESSGCP